MMISLPAARAVAARTRAAALLFTTPAALAPGTARLSASMTPRPRCRTAPPCRGRTRRRKCPPRPPWRPSPPGSAGRGPRLVWTRTPVALTTSVSEAAVAGSSAAAESATWSGVISAFRARSCARPIAALTRSRPTRRSAARMRGSLSSWSVRGIFRSAAPSAEALPLAARSSTVVTILRGAADAHRSRRLWPPLPGWPRPRPMGNVFYAAFLTFTGPRVSAASISY